jgi:putative N-acetyltransferase (TIGR04045 family)
VTGTASAAQVEPDCPPAGASIVCRQAGSAAALADHYAIRHQVFVEEQSVFVSSDLDEHDQDDATIRLIGYCDGVAAGSVRIFEFDRVTRLWQGDRLAVLPAFRVRGLGAPLVRCAVATAAVRGGTRMIAHIQLANVRFFGRLGWDPVGDIESYAGLPHQPMSIALPTPEQGVALTRRLAAGVSVGDL